MLGRHSGFGLCGHHHSLCVSFSGLFVFFPPTATGPLRMTSEPNQSPPVVVSGCVSGHSESGVGLFAHSNLLTEKVLLLICCTLGYTLHRSLLQFSLPPRQLTGAVYPPGCEASDSSEPARCPPAPTAGADSLFAWTWPLWS